MLLNALTNYLSNQPATDSAASVAAPAAAKKDAESPVAEDLKDLYQVSDRAVLISAVASEFDVTALSQNDLGKLQTRLQEYGLLNGRDLTGMQYLFQAGAAQAGAAQAGAAQAGDALAGAAGADGVATETAHEVSNESEAREPLNALAVLENLRNNIAEQGGSFNFRQQIGQLHTLVSNLASARPH